MALTFDNYTVVSDKGFEAAVLAVWARAEANGFTVLYFHDLQTIFRAKGFQQGPAGVVEICHEPFGSQMLTLNPQMSLMMPCKIAVYAKEGRVYLSAPQSRLIGEFTSEFAPITEQLNTGLRRIVDEAR